MTNKNTYWPDDLWDQKRDNLAASIMLREAANLLQGHPADKVLVDAAVEAASLQMALINIMPESAREAEAA